MLRRLRRPGYWIVLLIILTVYFYQQYREREERERREALFRLYRSYGETMLRPIRERNLTGVQRCFDCDGRREISLEEIALFVTTLRLDRTRNVRWHEWQDREGNITLRGELQLEENRSYPMEMMVVKRGEKVLMRRLRVGDKTLELKREGFPFDAAEEQNRSRPTPQTLPSGTGGE